MIMCRFLFQQVFSLYNLFWHNSSMHIQRIKFESKLYANLYKLLSARNLFVGRNLHYPANVTVV